MNGLELIWSAAGLLASGATLWLLALVVLRLAHERRSAEAERRRARVLSALAEMLKDANAGAALLASSIRDAGLMADALLQFQDLVRGPDQTRVLDNLRGLGVDGVLRDAALRGVKRGRVSAAEALAAIGGPVAVEGLEQLAASTDDPELRLVAWDGLMRHGAPPSVASVISVVERGGVQPSLRLVQLVRDLVSRGPSAAAAALDTAAPSAASRALIVDAMGYAGDYAVLPWLIARAEDPDPDVRAAAMRSLGRLQHPQAQKVVATALTDPDWPVRAAAAQAAGAAGFVACAESLSDLLGQPEWWVRFRAGEALSRLGAPGAEVLRRTAAHGDAVSREAASRALAEHRA